MGEDTEDIMKRIAGEIVVSGSPSVALKKWRLFFGIPQSKLAEHLGISPSVICDYESGRRKSPGVNFVRKIIKSFVELDSLDGVNRLASLNRVIKNDLPPGAIMDIKEFERPVKISDFCNSIDAKILTSNYNTSRFLYGYTYIDAIRAITELSANELIMAFGKNSERSLIFTNIRSGKSIMVALKTAQAIGSVFRPTLVVLHTSKRVDKLAVKIAHASNIILCSSRCRNIEKRINQFR